MAAAVKAKPEAGVVKDGTAPDDGRPATAQSNKSGDTGMWPGVRH